MVTLTRAQVKALIRAVAVVEMAVDGGRLDYTTRAWFDLHDAEARLKHALIPAAVRATTDNEETTNDG